MSDSPGVDSIALSLCSVALLVLTLLYWLHRRAVRKLRGDLDDKDAVISNKDAIIRDLQKRIYEVKKQNMSATGTIPRRVREEMENLSAKLDMLKDPMEEFRTRVEDIERDIAKLTKYEKGDER